MRTIQTVRYSLYHEWKPEWKSGFIALFQQEEYAYAKYLADKMNIPLKIIYDNKEVAKCIF